MQILNKNVDIRDDVCFRVTSNGKILDLNKTQVENIMEPFEELRRGDNSISNIDNLITANSLSREKRLTRVKKLEEQEKLHRNAGFAMVGSITIVGTLVVAFVIFILVRMILVG